MVGKRNANSASTYARQSTAKATGLKQPKHVLLGDENHLVSCTDVATAFITYASVPVTQTETHKHVYTCKRSNYKRPTENTCVMQIRYDTHYDLSCCLRLRLRLRSRLRLRYTISLRLQIRLRYTISFILNNECCKAALALTSLQNPNWDRHQPRCNEFK